MNKHLPSDFSLIPADPNTFWEELGDNYHQVFSNRRAIDVHSMLTQEERDRLKANRKNYPQIASLAFFLKKGSQLVGWHIGDVKEPDVYYMRNSAIVADFRGQKLYEKMLLEVMGILKEKGFQVLTSTHHGNNPAVIIPKLRCGFVISGSEMHERFGFLIHMKYLFNEKRRQSYNTQIGLN